MEAFSFAAPSPAWCHPWCQTAPGFVAHGERAHRITAAQRLESRRAARVTERLAPYLAARRRLNPASDHPRGSPRLADGALKSRARDAAAICCGRPSRLDRGLTERGYSQATLSRGLHAEHDYHHPQDPVHRANRHAARGCTSWRVQRVAPRNLPAFVAIRSSAPLRFTLGNEDHLV